MPRKSTIRVLFISGALSAFLTACAGPPALQLISFALDGISYLTTDKTIADHGLSQIAGQDCKMMRSLQGNDICKEEPLDEDIIETATLPKEDHEPAKP
jgi:hypothetical protein